MNASKRPVDFELTDYNELWRPQYHFSTLDSRVNDPNGLVYYNGVYHLYYQCLPHILRDENPKTAEYLKRYRQKYPHPVRQGQHWGHATSTDLIHWQEQEVALFPDDVGYMWSGTAVVDEHNTSGFFTNTEEKQGIVVAYSTNTQHIGIAYSTDGGNTFQKVSTTEPVLKNPGICSFRDPHIFWHEETKQWKMVVAGKGGKMWIYEAPDLLHWSLCSTDDHINTECPNLFPMTVEGTGEKKWILSCVGRSYYVGSFDGKRFMPESDCIAMNEGSDAYAGITFSGLSNGRVIMISWLNTYDAVADGKWNGCFTVPVEMKLIRNGDSYRLLQLPVKELSSVKERILLSLKNETVTVGNNPLAGVRSNCFDLCARVDMKRSKGGFALAFCQGEGDGIVVSYDPSRQCMSLDRHKMKDALSSFQTHASRYDFFVDPSTLEGGVLDLRLLVDVSNLELFVNRGYYYFPMRIQPFTASQGLSLLCEDELVLEELCVDACSSIWFNENKPTDAVHISDDSPLCIGVGQESASVRVSSFSGRPVSCSVADGTVACARIENGVLRVLGKGLGETEIKLFLGDYYRFLAVRVTDNKDCAETSKNAKRLQPIYRLQGVARAIREYNGRISIHKYGSGIAVTVSDDEYTDISFSSDVTLYGRGVASVLWRVRDNQNFYCVDFDAASDCVRLWRRVDGVDGELARIGERIAVNLPQSIGIEASGEQIKIFSGGKLIIETSDGALAFGKLGLNGSVSDVSFGRILYR